MMLPPLAPPTLTRAQARLGTTLSGRWRLDAVLGVGGMGSVFEARHRNGYRVAIKILHPELTLDHDVLRRFLQEGYLANAVEHPGAVRVLDDGMTDEGLPFLVMELLDGESLDDRLTRLGRGLSLPDALAVGVAMLDVLAAAHERGIIHRDIKPENVFLLGDGGVKLLDFGIASLLDSMSGNGMATTRPDTMVGTPTFMPREQAQGKLVEVDGQSDLWSVGATLFYALSRQFLFDVGSVAEFIQHLMSQPVRPLRQAVPSVPEAIAAVVDRALLHDRGARWQSAAEMKKALEQAAREVAIEIPEKPSLDGFMPLNRPRNSAVSLADWGPASPRERVSSLPEVSAPRKADFDTETLAADSSPPRPTTDPTRFSASSVPPTTSRVEAPDRRVRYAVVALVAAAGALVFLLTRPSAPPSPSIPAVAPEPVASWASAAPSASVAPLASASVSGGVASAQAVASGAPVKVVAPRPASSPGVLPVAPKATKADEDLGSSRYLPLTNPCLAGGGSGREVPRDRFQVVFFGMYLRCGPGVEGCPGRCS